MKVLIISPVDLPVPAVRGGAVAELIESLMARHEVHRDFELTVISAACDDAAKKQPRYIRIRGWCFSTPPAP